MRVHASHISVAECTHNALLRTLMHSQCNFTHSNALSALKAHALRLHKHKVHACADECNISAQKCAPGAEAHPHQSANECMCSARECVMSARRKTPLKTPTMVDDVRAGAAKWSQRFDEARRCVAAAVAYGEGMLALEGRMAEEVLSLIHI
mgnify:CR=1 FL=1